MKTIAITALIGTLVAIPFLIGKKKPVPVPVEKSNRWIDSNPNLRYDVDDLLT